MTATGGWRFRPRLWPTVAAGVAVLILVALGTWQLQRLDWKTNLIAERRSRMADAPMPLPRRIVDPAALEYRPVRLTGRFLHDREMTLGPRSYRRRTGYHVVTPMALPDGRTILVDRGWVPAERTSPDSRPESLVAGEVVVEGVFRTGGWRGLAAFRPENQPAQRLWFWPDLPAMARWAGLENPVTQVYVAAGPAPNPGGLPIGGRTPVDLRNDHLQYAVTWYALALALVVIYVVHQSRPERPHAED